MKYSNKVDSIEPDDVPGISVIWYIIFNLILFGIGLIIGYIVGWLL